MNPEQQPQPDLPPPDNLAAGVFGNGSMEHRIEFLTTRFARLNEIEQALVLSEMESLCNSGSSTDTVEKAVALYKQHNPEDRSARFLQFLRERPEVYNDTVEALIDQHQDYFPALIAVLNAVYAGEDVGLLTARGNREGHRVLLDALEDFIGHTIPRRNMYFVNDTSRNGRLPKESTAARKLQVLRDFLNGFYVDENGAEQPMSRKFDKVVFYDDERKNIELVDDYAKQNGLGDTMQAVDAKQMNLDEQWDALVCKIEAGARPEPGREPVIHFFDIDGTLINIPARMYVIDTRTDARLITITQEDFAHNPKVEYWIELAQQENPDVPAESLVYDFEDFRDPERIEQMIRDGLNGNKMFVPKEKRSVDKHKEGPADE